MANRVLRPLLTEHQQLHFQRRLSHYLNDYEYRNKVLAKVVAEKIGISTQKFSYVKSQSVPYPKFINSLDYLAKLGSLKQMSITEFVEYLESRETREIVSDTGKMAEWKRTMIDAFEPLTSKSRASFLDLCKKSLRDGKRKMEALIEIVNILQEKDVEAIEALRDALKRIT